MALGNRTGAPLPSIAFAVRPAELLALASRVVVAFHTLKAWSSPVLGGLCYLAASPQDGQVLSLR